VGKAKAEPKQISVRLPAKVYDDLRRDGFELHKSHTAIITEALVLYHDLAARRKTALPPATVAGGNPAEV
jgi:hypothetical protein